MATYADIYVELVMAFTPPADHCVCKLYGARTSSPTDVPDLSNLIATSDEQDPPDFGTPVTTRFTFDPEPALTPLDHFWLTLERTGSLTSVVYYRLYYETFSSLHWDMRTGSDPVTGWSVNVGGFSGSLVIGDQLVYDRGLTVETTAFGVASSAAYVAGEFIPPPTPVRISRRFGLG